MEKPSGPLSHAGRSPALEALGTASIPFCKRFVDVTLAVVLMLFLLPLMIVIWCLLWVEGSGNVIYSQQRLGRYGTIFTLYKFRKFPANWGGRGAGVTVANDARMTRLGRVLERTKLDELPQLWNILLGEMSFVGPRPETGQFGALFSGRYRAILEYQPGIFGPSQVANRNEGAMYPMDEDPEEYYRRVLFPAKAERDLQYYPRASCASDMAWLVRGTWESVFGIVNWTRFFKLGLKPFIRDVLAIELVWLAVSVLELAVPHGSPDVWGVGTFVIPTMVIGTMWSGGCYRCMEEYFSIYDIARCTTFSLGGWVLGIVVALAVSVGSVPGAALVLSGFMLVPLLIVPRMLVRFRSDRGGVGSDKSAARVVIYGAGAGGVSLAFWATATVRQKRIVGFLDDNEERSGRLIRGLPVLGGERDFPNLHEVYGFDEMWIAQSCDGAKESRIRKICEEKGVRLSFLSGGSFQVPNSDKAPMNPRSI